MAKKKGKKFENIGQSTSQQNVNRKIKKKKKVKANKAHLHAPTTFSDHAVVKRSDHATNAPRFLPDPAEAQSSVRPSNGSRAFSRGNEKDMDNLNQFSGFIFMCNGRTKPECYQYRVFGLPMAQKEVVEKIKPGAKLFLYDFDQRLLYGVYSATTQGMLNLEPAAFGGRYPAQVRFEIFEECLPVDERTLRRAISDNYQGSKFKQELNSQQVNNLLLFFRPFDAASVAPMPFPVARAVPPMAMPPPPAYRNQYHPSARQPPRQDPFGAGMHRGIAHPAMKPHPIQQQMGAPTVMPPSAYWNKYQPSARMPPRQDPYVGGMHSGRAPPTMERQPVQQQMTSQHEMYRTTATTNLVNPNLGQQHLPPPNDQYYPVDIQQPHMVESAQIAQYHYPGQYAAPVLEPPPVQQRIASHHEWYKATEVQQNMQQQQQQHAPVLSDPYLVGASSQTNDPYLVGASTQTVQDPNARYSRMVPPPDMGNMSYPLPANPGGSLVQVSATVPATPGGGGSSAGGNVPVSYYSFGGATQMYR